MKFLTSIYRFFLSLRYKVVINGEDVLKSKNSKFILPNHQAIVDPQLIFVHIYKYMKVAPVATEIYFKNPILKIVLEAIHTIPVSDLSAGNRDPLVLKTIYDKVINALSTGHSILLYPSGQIAGQGYEKIFNKQSAWAIVKNIPEDTQIIGVRISGLWGSMWSRAWIGKTPDFFSTFLKGIWYIFANLFFFLPRRKITIEFEDITQQAREKSKNSRIVFNTFLESFYNKNGEEKVNFLKHYFYASALRRKLPETIQLSVIDISKKDTSFYEEITADTFNRVKIILQKEVEINDKNIRQDSSLSLDLTIDSLGLVNIISAIEKEFESSAQFEISQVRTVADLCLLAMGYGIDKDVLKPSLLNTHNSPINNIYIDSNKNIIELFFDVFYKNNKESFTYDKTFGSTSKKDFLLKAMVVSKIIKKEVKGQYVGIMLPALQSTTLLVMATYLAGKTPVMLNWTVGKKVLDHCIDSVKLQKILTVKLFYDKVADLLSDGVKQKCIFFEQKAAKLSLFTKLSGVLSYKLHYAPNIKIDDIAVILFTSGSESLPKAVALSHKNIVSDLHGVFEKIDIRNNQILLSFLPPFHSFGFTVLTILPLISGVKVAYTPDPTDSREIIRLIRHTKADILLATPTFLKMILTIAQPKDIDSLKLVITGAESLKGTLIKTFHERSNPDAVMLEGYGITECAPVISLNPVILQKEKSVGKLIGGVEALIVDINSNIPVNKGDSGMLLVRGNNVFKGYLDTNIKSPFVTVEDKQYYKTGDLGYIDSDGYLFITGRLKRFLKIAGEMISLPAIENVLLEKYGNTEVTVLAVEGKDTIEPPQIVLFSIQKIDLTEVNLCLKESGFSNLFKIHRLIQIEEIPLLGTGKTDYKVLKEMI